MRTALKSMAILGLCIVLFGGCRTGKKAVSTVPLPDTTITQSKAIALHNAALAEYQWLRMNARLAFTDAGGTVNATARIKMRQDSVVWLSVTALIEAARAIVDKDSAQLINRLKREYLSLPVASLRNLTGIEGLSLVAVQRLLTGSNPFAVEGYQFSNGIFSRTTPQGKEEFTINPQGKLLSYSFKVSENKGARVEFDGYKTVGGRILPGRIVVEAKQPELTRVELSEIDYTFVEDDQAPFSVPQGYTRLR